MPADTFRAAPPIDLTNPKLPKTLKEIADIAFAELEKIKGTRQGWRLTGITLLKVTGRPEFKGRWCYIVHFTDGAWGSAAFPVTVDGRLGTLIDEKDPSVNASGSYREDPEE